jgi:hypothetical protein
MLSSAALLEIVEHLGGQARLEAVGARNFVADDSRVSFNFRNNPNGVHAVTIARQSRDKYRMDCFGPIAPGTFQAQLVASAGGIVAENLATVLGRLTGLESLHHHHF